MSAPARRSCTDEDAAEAWPDGRYAAAESTVVMAVLVADRLTKEYGEVVALEEFTFAAEPGELVAMVGHNGSGKSTFLRLVAGLLEPSDGVLVVANAPAGSVRARAEVSFVPDQPVLYDDLSVNEHIEYTGRLHGEHEWPERADVLLDVFGLTE